MTTLLIKVVFVFQEDGITHQATFPSTSTVTHVKERLVVDLNLPFNGIQLHYNNKPLDLETSLESLGPFTSELPEITMIITTGGVGLDGSMSTLTSEVRDLIDVIIRDDSGRIIKTVPVAIDRSELNKTYIGGYRNKKTGAEFHHAGTQTKVERKEREGESKVEKNHRCTQTVILKGRSIQTKREQGTQMTRKDLYLDESKTYTKRVSQYFSSEQLFNLKLEKTIVIQSHWRGYRARCRAAKKRSDLIDKKGRLQDIEETKTREAEEKHKREIERRMKPRTFEDFEILYNELENWRLHETRRIHESGMQHEERHEALAQLLHKETKLLQTIDRLKLTANKENREKKIKKMLELMSSPKKWAMSDGEVASVHTPFTTRARELLELHNGLNLEDLTIDQRLDVLLHVKWTVKEFDCNLTREIVELIDMEADLLNRGRDEKSLSGLRMRVSRLFLTFIETPEFNPEANRFQRVPRELLHRPNVEPLK